MEIAPPPSFHPDPLFLIHQHPLPKSAWCPPKRPLVFFPQSASFIHPPTHVFFSFLSKKFRSFSISSPEIQIHSASPKMLCQSSPCLLLIARKMIFLPLNHAAALSPSSLNVDSLSIYIHLGPFFSFFIFFFKRGLNISQSQPPSFLS